jgi:putative methionine-R-sulfoxide reductase with GAF domain
MCQARSIISRTEEARNAYRTLIKEITENLTRTRWLGLYFLNQMNNLLLKFPSQSHLSVS